MTHEACEAGESGNEVRNSQASPPSFCHISLRIKSESLSCFPCETNSALHCLNCPLNVHDFRRVSWALQIKSHSPALKGSKLSRNCALNWQPRYWLYSKIKVMNMCEYSHSAVRSNTLVLFRPSTTFSLKCTDGLSNGCANLISVPLAWTLTEERIRTLFR